MAEVAFIIPHKGREQLLHDTLASIAAQEAVDTSEIIVVTKNNSLEPATLAAAEPVQLRVLSVDESLTISEQRNRGVEATDAQILAFIDADISLAPHWLRTLRTFLQDSENAVVSAMQISGENPTPLEDIRTALSNAAVDAAVSFLPGRNLLLKRSTFDAVGGFPEHLVTCEDYYFTDKAAGFGRLWYTSKASYIHLGEDKRLDEMFSKEIWRGQSNLLSLRDRHVPLGEWPSFLIPPWITAAAVFAPLLVLLGQPLAAGVLLLLGAVPFMAYVIRLYFLAHRRIKLHQIIVFYGYYFPARAWGTLVGALEPLGSKLHNH